MLVFLSNRTSPAEAAGFVGGSTLAFLWLLMRMRKIQDFAMHHKILTLSMHIGNCKKISDVSECHVALVPNICELLPFKWLKVEKINANFTWQNHETDCFWVCKTVFNLMWTCSILVLQDFCFLSCLWPLAFVVECGKSTYQRNGFVA